MEEQQPTPKIISFIAERRLVKYVQFAELSSFMICGYLLTKDLFSASVMFFFGITFAILAGESALLEHDLDKEIDDGC